jgi:hypothetical protein
VDIEKKKRDQILNDSSFCDRIHIFYLLKEVQSHDLIWDKFHWELCVGWWVRAESRSSSSFVCAISWQMILCSHAFGSCETLSLDSPE